jgi:UDP:flavonoid glycosyltransferase YjiC (YdhE family)
MAAQNEAHGFLDAASLAFLAQRHHNRRLRAAAVRELKGVSAEAGADLQSAADRAAEWPDGADGAPRLSIVIMVVGSRGDVQPFIPIGRRLAERHRVRIATHRVFRPMVEQAGLEFYPLAGDPHELMEYMVKTGGRIIPTRLDQLVGDVPRKRAMIAEILASTWGACTEADPDRPDAPAFRADAIVANPPSYGHIHCAEALHVPLHMMFTMPWSPTSAYPHPFARSAPGRHHPVPNFLSYGVVDLLVWGGIGDLVNAFRQDILRLPPIAFADGAALLEDNEVPFTYLWPAALVPRPDDWGPHIDLANFVFHDQARGYEPPSALRDFLAAGEPPIYVGFGSVRVEDPAALTRTILTAFDKAGARGIVSEGWAHLGGETLPPDVLLIGDCPHDWLFPRCRAVCHHGGAGTTAAGLRAGLPTIVVPSFGDQFFWGRMVANSGAGPEPIPITRLDSATLAEAFELSRQSPMRERASALGARLRQLDGVELAVRSVYRHLPWQTMRCSNHPGRLARVHCDTCGVRLCRGCGTAHSAHRVRPNRAVDWGARPARGLVGELGELMGDAARALQAGLDEIIPRIGPRMP